MNNNEREWLQQELSIIINNGKFYINRENKIIIPQGKETLSIKEWISTLMNKELVDGKVISKNRIKEINTLNREIYETTGLKQLINKVSNKNIRAIKWESFIDQINPQ